MDEQSIVGETAEVLIAQVSAHGFTITKADLARWHRAGLLPRPQRHSLGRPRGMISIYPVGTSKQLLALCTIHRSEKRLAYVVWRLWWEGYEIPIGSIRQFLEEACRSWQRGIEDVQRLNSHPEHLSKVLDRSPMMRYSQKTLRGVRKRVGREDFPIFLRVLLRIASGTFEGYVVDLEQGIDECHIVEKGFGLLRARTNRLADAEPWLTGETGEVFQGLSSHIRSHWLGEGLDLVSEEDLIKTCEELRSFLSAYESISKTFDLLFSRGAFGFSVLADAIREFGPRDQAMMLLFWRMFRSWGLGPNQDQQLEVARQWHQVWFPLFQGMELLRVEVPAIAELFAPKQMGLGLRWKLTMEWMLDQARQFAERSDVQAFFARHPELIEVLEASNMGGKSRENPKEESADATE